MLARLARSGFRFLATAPQPDQWSADHGGPEDALLGPESIRKRVTEAGGVIDGDEVSPLSMFAVFNSRHFSMIVLILLNRLNR